MSHCLLGLGCVLLGIGLVSFRFPAASHPGALIGYAVVSAFSAWAFSFLGAM